MTQTDGAKLYFCQNLLLLVAYHVIFWQSSLLRYCWRVWFHNHGDNVSGMIFISEMIQKNGLNLLDSLFCHLLQKTNLFYSPKHLYVTICPSSEHPRITATRAAVLFIGNLAWESPVEKLIGKLSACPGFTGVSIARHEDTGRSKGWALATFENREQVNATISSLNHSIIDDRRIYMRHDIDLEDHVPTSNVYIGNLAFNGFTDADLDSIMAGYGSYFHHIQTKSGK